MYIATPKDRRNIISVNQATNRTDNVNKTPRIIYAARPGMDTLMQVPSFYTNADVSYGKAKVKGHATVLVKVKDHTTVLAGPNNGVIEQRKAVIVTMS